MYCITWGIVPMFCNSKRKVTFKIVCIKIDFTGHLLPWVGSFVCISNPQQVWHSKWEELLFWAALRPCSGGGLALATMGIQIEPFQGKGTCAQESWNELGVLLWLLFYMRV